MSATIPTTSVQMREIREKSVDDTKSQSSSGSRFGGINKKTHRAMKAANAFNGVMSAAPPGEAFCSLSGQHKVHAAHILPHSHWSTAKLHEWLFYADVIPNGGPSSEKLTREKYTERNILWLQILWAEEMEPTDGGVVVVPELDELIEQAEQILCDASNSADPFRKFSARHLLARWAQTVQPSDQEPVKVYPYSIWFMNPNYPGDIPDWKATVILRRGNTVTTHIADSQSARQIPYSYSPSLPNSWKWCLCPIITSLVAWATIRKTEARGKSTMTQDAQDRLDQIDHYLGLCEQDTSSSSMTANRTSGPEAAPSSTPDPRRRVFQKVSWCPPFPPKRASGHSPHLTPLSSSTPSHQSKKSRQGQPSPSDSRPHLASNEQVQNAQILTKGKSAAGHQDGHDSIEASISDDEEPNPSAETKLTSLHSAIKSVNNSKPDAVSDVMDQVEWDEELTVEERYQEVMVSVQENYVEPDLVKSLEELEELMMEKVRRLIRKNFEKVQSEVGFSQAMRWLRSSEGDAVDDEIEKLKLEWMTVALNLEETWMSSSNCGDGSNVLKWQQAVQVVSVGP